MKDRKDPKWKNLKWRRCKKAAPEDPEARKGVPRTVVGIFDDDLFEWVDEAVAKGVDRVLEEFAGEGDVIHDPSGEIYPRLDNIVSEILFGYIDRVVDESDDYVAMIDGEPGKGRRGCYIVAREEFKEAIHKHAIEEASYYLKERLRDYDYRTD